MRKAKILKQSVATRFEGTDLNLALCNPDNLIANLGVNAEELLLEAIQSIFNLAKVTNPITLMLQSPAAVITAGKIEAEIRIEYGVPKIESTYIATFNEESLEKVELYNEISTAQKYKQTDTSTSQLSLKKSTSFSFFGSTANTSTNMTTSSMTPPPINVLLVDDNPTALLLTKRLLTATYADTYKNINESLKNEFPPIMNIKTVQSGREAIKECLSKTPYAFIIMDYQMPNMNGLEAAEKIIGPKEQPTVIPPPIVLLTASLTEETYQQADKIGITKCVNKPMKQNEAKMLLNIYVFKQLSVDEAEAHCGRAELK
ncbi:MAG: response regulator [Gammaproteobacteria bacterium]